jgi:hypothetical protein
MLAHDRYALALSMLEGDAESRTVLADLLEEAGDIELAQRARSRRRSTMRTLQLGLDLLPCRTMIGFASETVKESLGLFPGFLGFHGDLIVLAVERWAGKRIDAAEALEICERNAAACRPAPNPYVRNPGPQPQLVRTEPGMLLSAFQHAIAADQLVEQGNGREAAKQVQEVRRLIHQIVQTRRSFSSAVEKRLDRLQQVYKALLATENDAWPK